MTGKAFRHELKRLFHGIAVKMHFRKKILQAPNKRRPLGCPINIQMNNSTHGQSRTSSANIELLQYRTSVGLFASNGTIIKHCLS